MDWGKRPKWSKRRKRMCPRKDSKDQNHHWPQSCTVWPRSSDWLSSDLIPSHNPNPRFPWLFNPAHLGGATWAEAVCSISDYFLRWINFTPHLRQLTRKIDGEELSQSCVDPATATATRHPSLNPVWEVLRYHFLLEVIEYPMTAIVADNTFSPNTKQRKLHAFPEGSASTIF